MFVHSEILNQCKCGSKKIPDLDSDDMFPCWIVQCYDCGQKCHDNRFSLDGAVKKWNEENNTKNILNNN